MEMNESKPSTIYSLSTDKGDVFHIDDLRDTHIEISDMPHRFAVALIRIKPFIDKCIKDAYDGGPGLSLFKFLKPEKLEKLVKNGKCSSNTNCEYHYISQMSFCYGRTINDIVNKEELSKYEWGKNLLITVQLFNDDTRSYDTYATVVSV